MATLDLAVAWATESPTIPAYLQLAGLLGCSNRAQLKAAWLELTPDERRVLRPSRALAHHAWNLILRDRILTPGAAA